VGDNVFARESGIHTHGVLQHPKTYEPIPSALVGENRHLVFGKHSGRSVVHHVLHEASEKLGAAGLAMDEDLVDQRAEEGAVAGVIEELEAPMQLIGLTEQDVIAIALEFAVAPAA